MTLATVTKDTMGSSVRNLNGLGEAAVPTLVDALRSPAWPARAAAAEALGRIGRRSKQPGRIVDALAAAADDSDEKVHQIVVISMMGIPHETPASKAVVAKAESDPDPLIRALLAVSKQQPR